jgi:hypothetical protein
LTKNNDEELLRQCGASDWGGLFTNDLRPAVDRLDDTATVVRAQPDRLACLQTANERARSAQPEAIQ